MIQGQLVTLVPAALEDRQRVYEWCFHSETTKSHAGPPDYPHAPIASPEEFFGEYGYQDYYFTGERPADGRGFLIMRGGGAVGFVSYACFHLQEGFAELDIWMNAEAHCGKGYGMDALAALCGWLGDALGIRAAIMRPSVKNARANRAYQKAGFHPSDKTPQVFLRAEYMEALGDGDYGAAESALLVKCLRQAKNHTTTQLGVINLKVSLIGCGGIGQVHAAIIAESGHTFLSCCDEKAANAQSFADKYGCKPYTSLKALLEAEKPDVLHICTPHYTHVPLALYALKRGVHVFMEKPAASFTGDIDVLLAAADASAAQTAICFQNRYNASSRRAKALLADGTLGKPVGGRAYVSWSRRGGYYTDSDWRGSLNTEGTSVLINQSIHTLDLMQWLMGGEPVCVEGSTANRTLRGVINTEDTAEACLTFADGTAAIFHATVAYRADAEISLEILCERGTLAITGDELTVRYSDGRVEHPLQDAAGADEALGKSYWGSGHKAIVTDFYAHLARGEKFPLDAREGCKALRTCFDIVKSGVRREAVVR